MKTILKSLTMKSNKSNYGKKKIKKENIPKKKERLLLKVKKGV